MIQCDSGHMAGDLIACARYRIYDLRATTAKKLATYVLFVIHLPRSNINCSFVTFQGDPWVSFHIDDLRPIDDISISVSEAVCMSISEVFAGKSKGMLREEVGNSSDHEYGDISSPEPVDNQVPPTIKSLSYGRLHGCIQAAASKLKDTTKRCTERLSSLVCLIPKVSPSQHGENY